MFQKGRRFFTKAFFLDLIPIVASSHLLLGGMSACAQAPGLAWNSPIGGRVFAEDTSNNVYATSNGMVFVFNSTGALQNSNQVCPLPGWAQRDVSGNYYFLGNYSGSQDFGGIILTATGSQDCFFVKYDQNGNLQWAKSFGGAGRASNAGDLAINPDGSLMAAYVTSVPFLGRYDSNDGNVIWQTSVVRTSGVQEFRVRPFSGTNGAYLQFCPGAGQVYGGFYDTNGAVVTITSAAAFGNGLYWADNLAANAEPVVGTNDDIFVAYYGPGDFGGTGYLTRSAHQTKVWSEVIGFVEPYILANDSHGIYLGTVDGSFSKYGFDGALLWSTNYSSPVVSTLIDASGNRFISRNDGSIAKLQADSINSTLSLTVAASDGFGSQGFRFHLTGAPSTVCQISCSTNLVNWQNLGMVTNAASPTPFTDPSATNSTIKFYRAVLVQ